MKSNNLRGTLIVAISLCLVPMGAHLVEMSIGLTLSPAEYMIVQRIYAGW